MGIKIECIIIKSRKNCSCKLKKCKTIVVMILTYIIRIKNKKLLKIDLCFYTSTGRNGIL